MRAFAIIAPLVLLLALSVWFAYSTWVSVPGPPMPTFAYVALAGGVIMSLLVGCGLMALVFYSSRRGYDDIGTHKTPSDDR